MRISALQALAKYCQDYAFRQPARSLTDKTSHQAPHNARYGSGVNMLWLLLLYACGGGGGGGGGTPVTTTAQTAMSISPPHSKWAKSSSSFNRNENFDNNKLKRVATVEILGLENQRPVIEMVTSKSGVKFIVLYRGYINSELYNHRRYLFDLKFDPANVLQLDDRIFDKHEITIEARIGNVTRSIETTVEVVRDFPLSSRKYSDSIIIRQASETKDSTLPFFEGVELTADSSGLQTQPKSIEYEWSKYSRPDSPGTQLKSEKKGNDRNFIPDAEGLYRLFIKVDGSTEISYLFFVLPKPQAVAEQSAQVNQTISVEIFENHPHNKLIADLAGTGTFRLAPNSADNRFFKIDADTGKIWLLNVDTLLDFEARRDENNDNIYNLSIFRRDQGIEHEIKLDITLKNLVYERKFEPENSKFFNVLPRTNSFDHKAYEKLNEIEKLILPVKHLNTVIKKSSSDDAPLIITWSIFNQNSILHSQTAFRPITIKLKSEEIRDTTMRSLLNPFTNQDELDAFRQQIKNALAQFEKAANIKFVEVADNSQTVGDFRLFMADQFIRGGDGVGSYLGDDKVFVSPPPDFQSTNASRKAILHEIGHFLGLVHPFETSSDKYYASEKTVMSYAASLLLDTQLSEADINALQFLFGEPPEIL